MKSSSDAASASPTISGTIALIAPAEVSDEALDAAVLEARAVIDAGVPDDADGGAELQTADVGGRKISFAGAGADGDVILLVHGYGGDRNSWLFLQETLAAKYRVYALDLPGHGTSAKDVGDGTLGVLADAVAGVLDALGAESAVIAGHDWGAPVAWHAGLLRPDRFRAVIGLSVPFTPRRLARPTSVMPQADDALFYQLYFQTPGVAEAEFEQDVPRTIRRMLYSASGDVPRGGDAGAGHPDAVGMVPRRWGFLSRMVDPGVLPPWLTETDVEFFAGEFTRTGFRGGLNWYRNIDRNWELLAPFAGSRVTVPALYVADDCDLVVAFRGMDQLIANLTTFVPNLRQTIMLPGCGHWTQQERPKEVNTAMIDFLRSL